MEQIDQFAEAVRKLRNDIRAEVVAADLFSEGLPADHLIAMHGGQHKRAYRRDIDDISCESYRSRQRYLVLRLNRDSIYDSLPQGLFHQQKAPADGGSLSSMLDDYRRGKEEEREARAFFTPFENEFFIQKTAIEALEIELLTCFAKNRFDSSFLEMLDIDPDLPGHLISKLISLLPYADQIAGNIPLAAQCLELILGEKVSYEKKPCIPAEASLLHFDLPRLGIDFILGEEVDPDLFFIEFSIGPVKKEDVPLYLEGGINRKFLKNFFGFFIAAELEVRTTIKTTEQEEQFSMGEEPGVALLGYTTTL